MHQYIHKLCISLEKHRFRKKFQNCSVTSHLAEYFTASPKHERKNIRFHSTMLKWLSNDLLNECDWITWLTILSDHEIYSYILTIPSTYSLHALKMVQCQHILQYVFCSFNNKEKSHNNTCLTKTKKFESSICFKERTKNRLYCILN